MTPKTLTILTGSCVLNDAQDFDLAMFKVDQRRVFYEVGKGGENFREKNRFRCKVKISIL